MRKLFSPIAIGAALFLVSLVYYSSAALNFPALFNLDNRVNHAATRYIAEHHKIPVVKADDKEIYFTDIGTTRSLRPPFTYIVSAMAANLADGVVDERRAQRLGSPLIAALTLVVIFIGFWLAFNHIGLALLGSTIIGLMPKFVFLASCNNDDIGAIFSVSLLFSSVLALIKYKYKTTVLIALAFSLGLVLQTKYTAWLTLPWFGLFCLIILKPAWSKLIKIMPVLLIVCIAAGGWWVVFNMLNYGLDDPSAMRHAVELQASLSDIEPNRQGYASKGVGLSDLLMNHDQFVTKSYTSLIGYLEWIELDVGTAAYFLYGAIFLVGVFSVALRSRLSLKQVSYVELLILMLIISQCVFYVHHNLIRDIQPQARYILPIIMPVVYLFLRALAQADPGSVIVTLRRKEFGFQAVSAVALIAVCLSVYISTLTNYILPSYIAKPFYTSIKKPRMLSVEEGIKVESAQSMRYAFVDDKLELHRTGSELPALILAADFCELLPLNALITINVSAPVRGGLYLRLDKNNQGTFDDLYWRSFPAGQSVAVFSVNSQNCTGAKITLANKTYQLTLDSLQISELRIHQHGKPL